MIPGVELQRYRTLVFDCDGVILNSNEARADAFYAAALPYGEDPAQQLRALHIREGGVSRYVKFEIFLRDIVGIPVTEKRTQQLLQRFTDAVRQRLLHCEIAPGLAELRATTPEASWMVVSGADQAELRDVFAMRGMAHWFDAGIYGSPSNKDDILARELSRGTLRQPAIFFGDSRYDHEAAVRAGLDFLFISEWTDFVGWREYCAERGVSVLHGFC